MAERRQCSTHHPRFKKMPPHPDTERGGNSDICRNGNQLEGVLCPHLVCQERFDLGLGKGALGLIGLG